MQENTLEFSTFPGVGMPQDPSSNGIGEADPRVVCSLQKESSDDKSWLRA